MKCRIIIKAILFNVDETIFDNLDFGNEYNVKKDKLSNKELFEEFDYTDIGIRRVYEESKINDDLEIAVLYKEKDIEINENDIYKKTHEYFGAEFDYIDKKMRTIRLFSNNTFNIKEVLHICKYSPYNSSEVTNRGRMPFPDRINNKYKLGFENKSEWSKLNRFINDYDINYLTSNFDSQKLQSATFDYDLTYTANIETLRFMSGVIGLECLLGNEDNKSGVTYVLSRNCALLLSKDEKEYDLIKTDIKKLYKKRSSYVHTGFIKDLSESDIILVRDYLRRVIFRIKEININKKQLLYELDKCGIEKLFL